MGEYRHGLTHTTWVCYSFKMEHNGIATQLNLKLGT